jgi:arsenite-transporting ATPase
LRIVGEELYGDQDPTERLSEGRPFRVEDVGNEVVFIVSVPFAERSDVDVMRHGNELILTVGPYRRSIILPDSLSRRHVRRAQLLEGELRITFGLDP